MRFIKKLVILSGHGARGTLMLEKNSFGVWGKLSIFDLPPDNYRLVIIGGNELIVKKLDSLDKCVNFTLGEIGFDEIHAAIITDKVIMYGSNCAVKLPHDVIMAKVNRHALDQTNSEFITFSGRGKNNEDYFKQIDPSPYNDFALAEKNYYPAYVTPLTDTEEIEVKILDQNENSPNENGKLFIDNKEVKFNAKSDSEKEERLKPHELEIRYLGLIEAAAALARQNDVSRKATNEDLRPDDDKKRRSTPNVIFKPESDEAQTEQKVPFNKRTAAEKPEVIAMARRVTLRDYKVEGVKPTGRKATFFERSSAQLEKLMATNERYAPAEKLIPGSKFVKINYDSKRFYIVGTIGRDYICYGVPSVYSEVPPDPLCGYARWLPFNADDPYGEGFWIMYQDGVSGETIKS